MPIGMTCICSAGIPRYRRHEPTIVLAHRKEPVDVARGRLDEIERLLLVRRAESFEKQIVSLERAANRDLELTLQRLGQAEQQRVRNDDDVEPRLVAQPVEELADFLGLEPPLSLEHRDRHLAQTPCGSSLICRFDARRSAHGESHNRSSARGVCRKTAAYCSRNTLMPPKNTWSWLTLRSSVRVGV